MVGLLFRTPETVATETPASRAMSRMVYKLFPLPATPSQNTPTSPSRGDDSKQTDYWNDNILYCLESLRRRTRAIVSSDRPCFRLAIEDGALTQLTIVYSII